MLIRAKQVADSEGLHPRRRPRHQPKIHNCPKSYLNQCHYIGPLLQFLPLHMCYMLLSMFSCFTRIRKLASLHNLAIILDKIITLPFIRFSICNPFRAIKCTLTRQRFNWFLFFNPHYHSSGYYEVASVHGPSRTNRRLPLSVSLSN